MSTCSHSMVNFGELAAEIGLPVWDTSANFNGFRVLAALLHGSQVVSVSQTLRRSTQGATYVRQGDHQVGHWPTFLVLIFIRHTGSRTLPSSPKKEHSSPSHFSAYVYCSQTVAHLRPVSSRFELSRHVEIARICFELVCDQLRTSYVLEFGFYAASHRVAWSVGLSSRVLYCGHSKQYSHLVL